MNQAFSKIWILIILIVLIGGGIFAWQYFGVPKEEVVNETANWKTYRNEKFGYEIKYPINLRYDDVKLAEIGPPEKQQMTIFSSDNIPYGKSITDVEDGLRIQIIYHEMPTFPIDGYIQASFDDWKNTYHVAQLIEFESNDFKGLKGVTEEWNTISILAFKKFPGLFFRVSADIKDPSNKKGYERIFNQMLSTFRFIERDETADWKTYYNERYGIEFKYPKLWVLDEKSALAADHPDQNRNFVQINVSNGVRSPEDESMSPCQLGIAALVFQAGKLRESQQTFEEFVNFQIENPERGTPPAVKPKLIQTMIDGHNALKIEEAVNSCKKEFYYIEQSLDRYMTISFIVDKNEDKLIIDQMLSTFRFLE